MVTAKKAKRGIWLEILLVILVLLIVIAIGVLVSTRQSKVVNQDKCVEDYCEGTMWYECTTQADGFKSHVLRGEVQGKCGIEVPKPQEIVEQPQQIKKVMKQTPAPIRATKVEKCGNGEVEFGEGCGNCPEDVACPKGYSCIANECSLIGLSRVKGGQYCGYLQGLVSRRDERVPIPMVDYVATCEDVNADSTGDKVYDGKLSLGENVWLCSDKTALSLPQYVSMKLDKETIVSRIRVLQSSLRDDLNVKIVRVQVSVDSTDGNDGHWLELGSSEFTQNKRDGFTEVYTDPTSARWVRVIVDDVQNYPIRQFAIGEIQVYEARYTCNDNYDARVYKP